MKKLQGYCQRFRRIRKFTSIKEGTKDFVTKTLKRVENILIEELSKSKKLLTITEETGKILK